MSDQTLDIVGKDLLEQLMFFLYPDAETIYREYLQNAADSISEALSQGILSPNEGHISIDIDAHHKLITIEDNGVGIKASQAEMTLKYIAHSNKKNGTSAGFYGIGRLVGGGYCKKLIFVTSALGEQAASEITFDMDKIRDILNDDNDNSSASEVIHKVTSFRNDIKEDSQKHYFRVILEDILPDYQDVLLNEKAILSYLMQVAPLPYEATFSNNLLKPGISKKEKKYLDYFKQLNAINVTINDIVGIEKPYEIKFKGTEYAWTDENGTVTIGNAPIERLDFFSLTDPILGDLAWGWYAYTPQGTQIKPIDPYNREKVLTRGIRLRCHNIQIGDENVLNKYFKQARSHTYFNGEVFLLNPDIKPTADRSDIAPTSTAKRFQDLLESFFRNDLEKLYQEANKANKQIENLRKVNEKIRNLERSGSLQSEKKKSELAKFQQERKSVQEKLYKTIAKSKDEEQTQAMKNLAENVKKQAEECFKHDSAIPANSAPPEKEIDVDSLKLSHNEIELVKRIFNIIDTRFPDKYIKVVESIKEAILNDLGK